MTVRLPTLLVLLLAVTALCRTNVVRAAGAAGKTPIHRAQESRVAGTGEAHPVATGGTTLVFLGLLLAGAIVVRRLLQQRLSQRQASAHNPVTLLVRQQVDHELTVRLLRIGPRLLIVGSTAQGLSTLAEVTDPAEIAQLTGDAPHVSQAALFDGRAIGGFAGGVPEEPAACSVAPRTMTTTAGRAG